MTADLLRCGWCGSDDVTVPAPGDELFCHSCERSYSSADLRGEVVDALTARGVKAEHWHSGGGIVGIRVVLGSGADLFTTLETDCGGAWTLLDLCADDGELVAGVEVQVRPFGSWWGIANSPAAIAAAIEDLVGLLR